MCYHASMKGVCDTPLHMFGNFTGDMVVERCAFMLPWRAYAIRPYTFSVNSWVTWWLIRMILHDGGEQNILIPYPPSCSGPSVWPGCWDDGLG